VIVALSSALISASCTLTVSAPSRPRMADLISSIMRFLSGQAMVVRASVSATCSPATLILRTMPRSMILLPNSGSMTLRRASRISSAVIISYLNVVSGQPSRETRLPRSRSIVWRRPLSSAGPSGPACGAPCMFTLRLGRKRMHPVARPAGGHGPRYPQVCA
jgi:hypothetical protein